MKICAACSQELPKDKFSKKQWQLKQQRRCKECISANRAVQLDPLANDIDAPTAGEELFITPEQYHEKFCLHRRRRQGSASKAKPCFDDSEGGALSRSWSDEDLFKEPPLRDECPICFLLLPFDRLMIRFQSCCGKVVCDGCIYENYMKNNRLICPFCRAP